MTRVRFLGPDRIVSVGADGTLRLFDVERAVELERKPVEGLTRALEVCEDGTCVLTASPGTRIDRWNAVLAPMGSYTTELKGEINSVALGPLNARELPIALGGEDGLAIWATLPESTDPSAKVPIRDRKVFNHVAKTRVMAIHAVLLTPDGSTLVTAALDGLRFFDLHAKPREAEPIGRGQAIDARFSRDGRRLVVAEFSRSVIYDVATRHEGNQHPEPRRVLTAMFSPDGHRVVNATSTAEGRGVIVVWNADTGAEIYRKETSSLLREVVFGTEPIPKVMAAAAEDGTIRIFRLERDETATEAAKRWEAWQRKFGLTVNEDDKVVPLDRKMVGRELPRLEGVCREKD